MTFVDIPKTDEKQKISQPDLMALWAHKVELPKSCLRWTENEQWNIEWTKSVDKHGHYVFQCSR